MSDTPYAVIPNLAELVGEIQPDSIISRTFYRQGRAKAVLFGFDAGQELTEHSSAKDAVIQIVQGEAHITLDGQAYDLTPGCWINMPARLKHSVKAKTPLVLLLLMFDTD